MSLWLEQTIGVLSFAVEINTAFGEDINEFLFGGIEYELLEHIFKFFKGFLVVAEANGGWQLKAINGL